MIAKDYDIKYRENVGYTYSPAFRKAGTGIIFRFGLHQGLIYLP